jgi:hypothetical protein
MTEAEKEVFTQIRDIICKDILSCSSKYYNGKYCGIDDLCPKAKVGINKILAIKKLAIFEQPVMYELPHEFIEKLWINSVKEAKPTDTLENIMQKFGEKVCHLMTKNVLLSFKNFVNKVEDTK